LNGPVEGAAHLAHELDLRHAAHLGRHLGEDQLAHLALGRRPAGGRGALAPALGVRAHPDLARASGRLALLLLERSQFLRELHSRTSYELLWAATAVRRKMRPRKPLWELVLSSGTRSWSSSGRNERRPDAMRRLTSALGLKPITGIPTLMDLLTSLA